MKVLVLFITLLTTLVSSSFISKEEPVLICSWNIRDFGKTCGEEDIEFIANTVREFDIVLIQEVVAGDGGADAVARLNDALNRKGIHWDYTVSDPTYGDSYKQERYAFLWKPSRVKIVGDAWLEKRFKVEINREPYFATFDRKGRQFTLVNFHAITRAKQPETEVKYFKFFPATYPHLNLIFCGDFNLSQSHTVFNPLKKMGYQPAFVNQRTTLKQHCVGEICLASEFDNIFYQKDSIGFIDAGVIHFYKSFPSLKEANRISDHLPLWMEFNFPKR